MSSIKEKIIHNLIDLLPSLSDAINDIISLAMNDKDLSDARILDKIEVLSKIMAKVLLLSGEGIKELKKSNHGTNTEELKIYELFIEMLVHLSKSMHILLYLVGHPYPLEQNKRILKISDDELTTEHAIDYLFKGSKCLGDLVELLL